MLENKLGITTALELAEAEEKISKKKAIELFENGMLDKLEAGKFASIVAGLQAQKSGAIKSIPLKEEVCEYYGC